MKTLMKNHFSRLILIGSIFAISLLFVRIIYAKNLFFIFLIWNLFLAFIPFWILTFIKKFEIKNRAIKIGAFCSWLVFFPNAPYILTDLFHFNKQAAIGIWYDLILILSFAWIGLLVGFKSLNMIEEIISKSNSFKKFKQIIIPFLLFLSAFGIYLGRFLRWNSWDILHKPGSLVIDILDRITNPLAHPRTWGMTLGLGILLCLMYYSIDVFKDRKTEA